MQSTKNGAVKKEYKSIACFRNTMITLLMLSYEGERAREKKIRLHSYVTSVKKYDLYM